MIISLWLSGVERSLHPLFEMKEPPVHPSPFHSLSLPLSALYPDVSGAAPVAASRDSLPPPPTPFCSAVPVRRRGGGEEEEAQEEASLQRRHHQSEKTPPPLFVL